MKVSEQLLWDANRIRVHFSILRPRQGSSLQILTIYFILFPAVPCRMFLHYLMFPLIQTPIIMHIIDKRLDCLDLFLPILLLIIILRLRFHPSLPTIFIILLFRLVIANLSTLWDHHHQFPLVLTLALDQCIIRFLRFIPHIIRFLKIKYCIFSAISIRFFSFKNFAYCCPYSASYIQT